MIKPSGQILSSLRNLRGDDILMGWLQANLDAYRDDTVKQRDDIALRQAQGKAQVMDEFISFIRRSPDLIDKQRRDER